jgi:hypothetical protein
MRALCLALALAACATASAPDSVPAALRGCWIERRAEATLTMRWFPTNAGPLEWRGALNSYAPNHETSLHTFRLTPTAGELETFGWALCPKGEPHGPPCQPLHFRESSGDGEAFNLVASREHLRFSYRTGSDRLVLFDGARDGCD